MEDGAAFTVDREYRVDITVPTAGKLPDTSISSRARKNSRLSIEGIYDG